MHSIAVMLGLAILCLRRVFEHSMNLCFFRCICVMSHWQTHFGHFLMKIVIRLFIFGKFLHFQTLIYWEILQTRERDFLLILPINWIGFLLSHLTFLPCMFSSVQVRERDFEKDFRIIFFLPFQHNLYTAAFMSLLCLHSTNCEKCIFLWMAILSFTYSHSSFHNCFLLQNISPYKHSLHNRKASQQTTTFPHVKRCFFTSEIFPVKIDIILWLPCLVSILLYIVGQ